MLVNFEALWQLQCIEPNDQNISCSTLKHTKFFKMEFKTSILLLGNLDKMIRDNGQY